MLYEITLQATYYSQELILRWNYLSSAIPPTIQGAMGLVHGMGFLQQGDPPAFPTLSLFHSLRTIQSTNVGYNQVTCKAIYDVTDFYTTPFPSGTVGIASGGADASPTSALGFRTNRTRQDIGRGYKRVGGVLQANFAPGGTVIGDSLEVMEELAVHMTAVIGYTQDASTVTYSPVIVGKEKYTTESERTAYRYYASQAVQEEHLAEGISWEPYDTMRTQRSRQYGQGS